MAIATVAPLAAGLLPAAAASAHPAGLHTAASPATATKRIAPVAGDEKYLAYVVGTTSHKKFIIGDGDTTGTLKVLTKSGHTKSLGAIDNVPIFQLVGSILLESSFPSAGTQTTRWWDLAGAKHGTTTETNGKRVVSAAPDGWLATTGKGGTAIAYHHTDGTVTTIKDPLPASVDYAVSGGISGFTVAGDNDENGNGEIVYVPWKHLKKHTVLQKAQAGKENSCDQVGVKWAACSLDSVKSPLALVRLSDGKQVKLTKPCGFSAPALFNDTAAWVNPGSTGCPGGRVEMFDTKGHLTSSKSHAYAWFVRTGALGRFVTTDKKQAKLVGLKSATGKPKVLATA